MPTAALPTAALPEPRMVTWATIRRVALVVTFAVSAAAAVLWPLGDILYRRQFTTPDPWWAAVMILFASASALRHDKLTRRQDHLAHAQDRTNIYLEGLCVRLDDYGDRREAEGHRLATEIRGGANGTARVLRPVD